MWQGMSLRMRLNALFGSLMALGLAVSIGWIVWTAGARVKAEDESSVRLAREFIESAVASLKQTSEPALALEHLLAGLHNLRHVSIRILEKPEVAVPPPEEDDDEIRSPPRWFESLVHPPRTVVPIPVEIAGKSYGTIMISSNPSDETEEIWDSLVSLTLGGAALALAACVFNIFVINRALAPIGHLGEAVTRLEAGSYKVTVPLTGSPELVDISRKVNSLAGTLAQTTDDNRVLSEMLVTLQDDERKELARELHDEFGPYLFAIRAGLKSLQREFEKRGDAPEALDRCIALQDQVDALQQINRRVLERLRPPAMTELGLREALRALVAMWNETNPAVAVSTHIADNIDDLEETLALTVYRIVQEGLTNVFRHSGATEVRVGISCDPPAPDGRGALRIVVKDNGVGLPEDNQHGFGLLGMRERIWALNGKITVANATDGGVLVEATLPAS